MIIGCRFHPESAIDFRLIADLLFANSKQWSDFQEFAAGQYRHHPRVALVPEAVGPSELPRHGLSHAADRRRARGGRARTGGEAGAMTASRRALRILVAAAVLLVPAVTIAQAPFDMTPEVRLGSRRRPSRPQRRPALRRRRLRGSGRSTSATAPEPPPATPGAPGGGAAVVPNDLTRDRPADEGEAAADGTEIATPERGKIDRYLLSAPTLRFEGRNRTAQLGLLAHRGTGGARRDADHRLQQRHLRIPGGLASPHHDQRPADRRPAARCPREPDACRYADSARHAPARRQCHHLRRRPAPPYRLHHPVDLRPLDRVRGGWHGPHLRGRGSHRPRQPRRPSLGRARRHRPQPHPPDRPGRRAGLRRDRPCPPGPGDRAPRQLPAGGDNGGGRVLRGSAAGRAPSRRRDRGRAVRGHPRSSSGRHPGAHRRLPRRARRRPDAGHLRAGLAGREGSHRLRRRRRRAADRRRPQDDRHDARHPAAGAAPRWRRTAEPRPARDRHRGILRPAFSQPVLYRPSGRLLLGCLWRGHALSRRGLYRRGPPGEPHRRLRERLHRRQHAAHVRRRRHPPAPADQGGDDPFPPRRERHRHRCGARHRG